MAASIPTHASERAGQPGASVLPASEWPLEELLARCLSRPPDEAAWREFVRRYGHFIKAVIGRVLRAGGHTDGGGADLGATADELAQDVYLKLVNRQGQVLKQFRNTCDRAIYKYLQIIAVNVARDHLRRARAEMRYGVSFERLRECAGEERLESAGVARHAPTAAVMEEVERALAGVVRGRHRERDLMIFRLRFEAEMTIEEIIRHLRLKLSVSSVRCVIKRILARLRAALLGAGYRVPGDGCRVSGVADSVSITS